MLTTFLVTLAASFIGCVLAETALDNYTMWRNGRADAKAARARLEEHAALMFEVTPTGPPSLKAAVERHLAECQDCRAWFGAAARN